MYCPVGVFCIFSNDDFNLLFTIYSFFRIGCERLLFPRKQVFQRIKVLFHKQTYALSVERSLCEVAFVCLIICPYAEVSTWQKQILQFEVSDKRCVCRLHIVAIPKLTIKQQPVVKHPSAHGSFVLRIVPPSSPVLMFAPMFQFLLVTNCPSILFSCELIVPDSRLCIASEVWSRLFSF